MRTLFLLLCTVFILYNVSAQSTLSLITGEWAPYSGEKLLQKGFFSEIVVSVINDMKYKHELTFAPWKRCEKETGIGHYFATFPYAKTDKRSKTFYFSDPIYDSKSFLYYYKPQKDFSNFEYNKIQDLKNMKVVAMTGYYYIEDFKKAGMSNVLLDARNEQVALNLLIKGRAQFLPLNELVFNALVKKHYPKEAKNFAKVKKEYSTSSLNLMVSKKYKDIKDLINKFNQSLKKLKDNGTVRGILSKHKIP